ncbi:MAG: TonB-dependent receptor [Maricaulaceae bacterium]
MSASASSETFSIDIDESDAVTALNSLASQTNYPLLFDFDQVRDLRVNSLKGDYTLQEALDLILRDSGFSGNLLNREVIMISPNKPNETQQEEYPMNFKGTKTKMLTGASAALLAVAATPLAAQAQTADDEVIVTGIRQSLANAIVEKRATTNLTEIIQSEDIGKLPDQNLAEVLENITGIQITRTAGIGSAVQIRGTDDNRIEINGVSTVGSGGLGGGQGTSSGGRSGIDFQDLPASLIASLQVTKVPDAKAVEGTVGGTINLRTIRPLELSERLISVRVQGEHNDLSDEIVPRFSGTYGDKWDLNGGGEIGLVLSGSYAEQNVTALRPRVDRDAVVSPGDTFTDPNTGITDITGSAEDFQFLRIQFFDQRQDIFALETLNLAGTLEWAPSENLSFYFDGIYNDQTVNSEGSQVQLSGVSLPPVVNNTTNATFEDTDFGTILGPNGPINLGTVPTVTSGILLPGTNLTGSLNPNLRGVSNAGARLTESNVFSVGGDWEGERLSISAQASISTADTEAPNLSTTIDFINPNDIQPAIGQSLDNGTPLVFDLTDGALTFGIAQGQTTTPTTAELLDPANYQLRQVNQGASTGENEEKAFRVDFSYDTTDIAPFISSIDFGYRYNENSSDNINATSATNLTSATGAFNRPNADLFASIVIPGPDNFGDGDGRELFIENFLIIDPVLAFDDPDLVRDTLNAAITANNLTNDGNEAVLGEDVALIGVPTAAATASFFIDEETHALYAQANFDTQFGDLPVRGNAGLRWIETTQESTGATSSVVNGVATDVTVVEESSYDFFLPRFNLAIDATDDITLRGGIARDINRPDFGALSTSIIFGSGPNDPVPVGNPNLAPEAVWSYDASAEWYFAPSSLISVGFFHKSRTNLFTSATVFPPENLDANGILNIDVTDPCEAGGIFNPIANRNINSPIEGTGICTPVTSTTNGEGTTTQTGIELAVQYDLSGWEDQLGWASGFGFIGNYTYQTTGGSAEDFPANFADVGGSRSVFDALGIDNAQDQIQLQNLSRNSYNITAFYEKYGLSARARYTWRSSFQSTDPIQFGVPRVNASRGQLNTSVNYDINENINIGVEAINLLQNDADQFCVTNNSLLCFNGITDRRIVAGASFKF